MNNNFVPNITMFNSANNISHLSGEIKFNSLKSPEGTSFKDVLGDVLTNMNNEIKMPEELLEAQMSGSSEVDVHDVITAMAKAELGVSLATQVTSKVVSAYNTIMQISV